MVLLSHFNSVIGYIIGNHNIAALNWVARVHTYASNCTQFKHLELLNACKRELYKGEEICFELQNQSGCNSPAA